MIHKKHLYYKTDIIILDFDIAAVSIECHNAITYQQTGCKQYVFFVYHSGNIGTFYETIVDDQ